MVRKASDEERSQPRDGVAPAAHENQLSASLPNSPVTSQTQLGMGRDGSVYTVEIG